MLPINKNVEKALWHFRNFGLKRLVYSAGMPRSGSTLLFNIIRLILEEKYPDRVSSGWIEEVDQLPKRDIYLIKTHHLNRMAIWRAHRTFYTYRDIRDVMVSRLRKFGKEPKMGMVRYYLEQDRLAKKYCDVVIQYEMMVDGLPDVILTVARELNILVATEEIMERLPSPNEANVKEGEHSEDTLLHTGHVTGTVRGEWKEILPDKLIDQIHREFGWWFKDNGYEVCISDE